MLKPGEVRRARVAVAAAFFANGAAFASWAPRIPDVKRALGLSDGALGLALLGVAAGALLGTAAAGRWCAATGSRVPTIAGALAVCVLLPLPGVAGNLALLGLALAALGFADGMADVAMNTNGVALQRAAGRPLLHGLHAMWSLGALTGAASGAVIAGLRVSVPLHLAGVAVVLVIALLAVRAHVFSDLPAPAVPAGTAVRWWRSPRLRLLGIVALCAIMLETAPSDWSAVYLSQSLGAGPGTAGAGVAATLSGLLVGRLFGDRLTARFGAARAVASGAGLAAVGLGTGVAIGTVPAAMTGLAVLGLGASVVFPSLFGAAGGLADASSAAGIAVVGTLARSGGLVGPPVIGGLAELVGLPLAFAGTTIAAALAICVLARSVAAADVAPGAARPR